MASADLARSSTSRLAEFAALNEELAGLVRAGLPLELGLGAGARYGLAGRITDRLRQGRSLEEALREEGDEVPAAYRAVVEAGLKSGRLADAVETVSRTARAMLSLRRRLALAAIYPAVLVVTAYAFTVLLSPKLLEPILGIASDAGEPPPRVATEALWLLRENPGYWQWWAPAAALAILWATGGLTSLTMRLPGLGPALRAYRLAAFAELAAGLLDHGTPLDEAFSLGAAASGDRRLDADAQAVGERLRAGQPAAEALGGFTSMPRFARWMITAGALAGTLPATLRQVADWSGRRAAARADWFSLTAALVVTPIIGGVAVALFATASFWPVVDLLYRLGEEISG